MAMITSGKRLRQCREKAEYSLRELSQITGISKATLSRYENNGLENVPTDKLSILANVLKTTPDYLLGKDIDIREVLEKTYLKSREVVSPAFKKIIRKEISKQSKIDSINYKLQILNQNGLEHIKTYLEFLTSQNNMIDNSTPENLRNLLASLSNVVHKIKQENPNISENELFELIYNINFTLSFPPDDNND